MSGLTNSLRTVSKPTLLPTSPSITPFPDCQVKTEEVLHHPPPPTHTRTHTTPHATPMYNSDEVHSCTTHHCSI